MPASRLPSSRLDECRSTLRIATHADEETAATALLTRLSFGPAARRRAEETAYRLAAAVRENRGRAGTLDAFLQEFGLSNQEGVALMCLAESLLRVPDEETADKLIREKIAAGRWGEHVGHSDSLFVNASAWGLMLTGHLIEMESDVTQDAGGWLRRLAGRTGEPVVRRALIQAMRFLGGQFVLGRDIHEALDRATPDARYSYDMLGEGARTMADALRYGENYRVAIRAIGRHAAAHPHVRPGVSIKLSALHPRYEYARHGRVMDEMLPNLKDLLVEAKGQDLSVTIDAEEADRLDLSLDLFEVLARDPDLAGWQGLGLAVQAYQKRAPAVIDWLQELAAVTGRHLMVRLVKGAYWDHEIKYAQTRGVDDYPVFTRKSGTDVSFLACAEMMLAHTERIYPQFATHNAHTIAAVLEMAGQYEDFEFQRLYGMGELLYSQLTAATGRQPPCRIYAPVGPHGDLLAYLVRRLLENGANTSFVHRIQSERISLRDIAADPVTRLETVKIRRHPGISRPREITLPERRLARGLDLADPATIEPLLSKLQREWGKRWHAAPIIAGKEQRRAAGRDVLDPANRERCIGTVHDAAAADIDTAVARAAAAQPEWDRTGGENRAAIIAEAGDLIESRMVELMAIAIREGGKTIPDAMAEIREAVDFCRYYAARARDSFAGPTSLPGPVTERNELSLHGRGVFVAISPWNFPAAIFTGQIAAALAAGNAVLAKPAQETPLMAAAITGLLHEAGVPVDILHLLPGNGSVGAALVNDARGAGVAFTGSTATAKEIQRALSRKDGPIVPLIAETGGQNAMFVDSTALFEQVTDDVIASAFLSTGQRCSALRCLLVQDDIADDLIAMIRGAARELRVGDPAALSTDMGPVIDAPALQALTEHCARMAREARSILTWDPKPEHAAGHFLGPHIFEIESLNVLEGEVFGPVLHVVRFPPGEIEAAIDAVQATGYGLTLGVHSRMESVARHIFDRLGVGNTYINRNMVGSVVGMQPFGGQGLSGTGPKAGGPHYLPRFATEKVLTVNTMPYGGSAALYNLEPED